MKQLFSTAALVALLAPGAPERTRTQEEVELRWRGKVGDVLRYRMTQHQTTEFPMMPEGMESESAFVIRQEVKEVSPDGIGTLDVGYEALRVDIGGPMPKSYDSTREGEEAGENDAELAAMFEPILDARLHMKIDPSGHILEIDGLAEVMEEVFDQLENPAVGETFTQMFGEDSLRRMMEVNIFPSEPVSAGDTWQRTAELEAPMLGTMKFVFESEFQGVEKHAGSECAKIGVSGEMEIERAEDMSNPMEVSLDDSDIAGTMFFALDNGYLIESSMEMGMEFSFSAGEGKEDGMEMQMSSTTKQRMLRIGEDDPFFE